MLNRLNARTRSRAVVTSGIVVSVVCALAACGGDQFTSASAGGAASANAGANNGGNAGALSANGNHAAGEGGESGADVGGSAGASGADSEGGSGATARAGNGGSGQLGGSAGAGLGGNTGVSGSSAGGSASGGSAGQGPTCASAMSATLQLGFFPELRAAAEQEIHPFFQITNLGDTVTLDRLKIRYYYTNEANVAETGSCYWVTGDHCALVRISFSSVASPTATAKRYMEVTFPQGASLPINGGSIEVRVGFTAGDVTQNQDNDYSFDPNATPATSAVPYPYKPWLRATLYLDGQLVWGTEPCSTAAAPPAATAR